MIYDVTLPLFPELAVWPGDPAIVSVMEGDEVKVSRWTLGSHSGTHVDAPLHFSAGPGTVDGLDPAVLLGPCRLFHLPDSVGLITADVLAGCNLAGVTRVIFRTRNARAQEEELTAFRPDFVGMDVTAARRLVESGVQLIGVDAPSIESYGGSGDVHRTLLTAGVIALENLRLAAVPPGDYQLICAPLKLLGGDGAPARVFLVG